MSSSSQTWPASVSRWPVSARFRRMPKFQASIWQGLRVASTEFDVIPHVIFRQTSVQQQQEFDDLSDCPSVGGTIDDAGVWHSGLCQAEEIRIKCEDDATIFAGVRQMIGVGSRTKACFNGRRHIQPATAQTIRDCRLDCSSRCSRIARVHWRKPVFELGRELLLHGLNEFFSLLHLSKDFVAMTPEIGERGIDISQRKLRECRHNFVRAFSLQIVPDIDVLHANTTAGNARFAAADACGDRYVFSDDGSACRLAHTTNYSKSARFSVGDP